ncbi:MAG: competence/damage-inducible protein A, partial [Oscillospiraceae bacterium]
MNAEIIAVGTELLLGDILNTNAQFLSRELSQLGIAMYNQQVVGDNGPRLAQAVSIAKQRCDIVILSGGLGPTEDDLTKQTVAQLFNDELVYSIGVEKDIQAYFDRIKQPMAENNRRQAFVPKNGKYIKNENGTAPGIIFIEGEKLAILLPGPPKELVPMVENDVVPLLKKLVCGVIKSKYIKTIGIGESMLETKISDILEVSNPSAALYAKTGEVTIRITANADSSQEAEGALRAQMAALDKRISDYIYGVDVENIETVIVETLKKTLKTVATAESCTGGLVSSRITGVAGASTVFELGMCTYSDKQKMEMLCVQQDTIDEYTAVSSQVAAQMAQNVRTIADSDYGVATTGYAGPTGENVGLVFVAVATKEKTYVARHNFTGNRETITTLASQYALDLLRRVMFGLPQVFAVEFKREKPKVKNKLLKSAVIIIVMLAAAAGIAFGALWLKKDDRWRHLPVISDILNTQSVESVIEERETKNFFRKGFEQETADLLSGSWAQDLKLEGWVTLKNAKKEYAIGTQELAEKEKKGVVCEEEPIGTVKVLSGFTEDNLFKASEIEKINDETRIMLFDTDKNYSNFELFSVAKFSQEELAQVKEKTEAQQLIDAAMAANVGSFSAQPTVENEIIVLSQGMKDETTTLYFARKAGDSVKVGEEKETPDDEALPQEETAGDEAENPEATQTPEELEEPSPSPTASASPSATASAKPTASPKPTATAKPTAKPT